MTNEFDEESEATIKLKQTGSFIMVEVEGSGFCYDLAADLAKSIQPNVIDNDIKKAH